MKRVCIIGKGSIGVRHSKIFHKLGLKIYFYRTFKNLKSYEINFKYIEIDKLKKIKDNFFDLIVVSNPTSLHLRTLKKFHKYSNNFLIEKPLTSNMRETKILEKFIFKKNIRIFSGYFLRHYKNILKLKSIISKNKKKIKFANFFWHTYMPDWHKGEDFKKSYASNKLLGGGVIQTCSHEIDLALFFFGPAKEVYAKNISSNKILNVESSVIIVIKHINGVVSQVNLDFLAKNQARFIKIYSNELITEFDFKKKYFLKLFNNKRKKIMIKKHQDISKAYEEQNKYVLKNLRRPISNSYSKSIINTEKTIQYCKESIKKNKVVKIII